MPGQEAIGPTDVGLIMLMQTPDEYIEEQGATTIFLLIVVVVFFCVAGILVEVVAWMVRK